MRTGAEERTRWDDDAAVDANRAVWGEDDWADGTADCVDEVLAGIQPALADGKVLDLGCGVGRLLVPLAWLFERNRWVGVDVSPTMLDHARAQAHPDNTAFLVGDGRVLPDPGPFDAAYSVLLFQHLPTAATASYVAQVAAALRPAGRFVFQYVDGPTGGDAYSWAVDEADATAWCADAGLTVVDLLRDRVRPAWSWLTAERP